MKRQSLVLLAVAFVAAGAAGCFKDPVSGLRSGPSGFNVDHSSVDVRTGDSTAVTAFLLDNAGNQLAVTGASWTSTNPAVAVVRMDTTQAIPGAAYTKGFIRGVDSVNGGWTNVIVSSRGIADTIRVTVIPSKLTAQHVAYAGTPLADTVIIPASVLPPVPAQYIAYSAPDTLVLNGSALVTFDTSKVTVQVATTNGASQGLIVSKTPDQLKVIFQTGTAGKVMVQHLLLTPGNPKIGTVAVDTLIGDSVAVAPWRFANAQFGGAIVSGGTSVGDTVSLTAGTGQAFYGDTKVGFGGIDGVILSQTPTTITTFAPTVTTYTGPITVYNVQMVASGTGVDSVIIDSISTHLQQNYTVAPALFPSANINLGGGELGDTITITAPAPLSFASGAQVLLGNRNVATSDTAWVLSNSGSALKLFAKRGGQGTVTITSLNFGAIGVIPELTTGPKLLIDSLNTAFADASSEATAHALVIPANDTLVTYSAVSAAGSGADYSTFTTTAAHKIFAEIAWFGTGCPYGTKGCSAATASDPTQTDDLDLIICNVGMACDESVPDLLNYAAATAVQPQSGTSPSQPIGQYWAGVFAFTAKYAIVYQLTLVLK